jgi:hypothetical protein
MNRPRNPYVFEWYLAIVLILLFIGFSSWQTAGRLDRDEVQAYIAKLDAQLPSEMDGRAEFLARLAAWGEADDGRAVQMLTLVRFRDTLRPVAGGPSSGSAAQLNAEFEREVRPGFIRRGIFASLAGEPTMPRDAKPNASNLMGFGPGVDDWDRAMVIRYPGRRAYFDTITDPAYLAALPGAVAALDVVVLPLRAGVTPDLRWFVGAGFVFVFVFACWRRAAQRAADHRRALERALAEATSAG